MAKLSTTFITMFKEPVQSLLSSSIMARAHKNGILASQVESILESVAWNHHRVDDTPYGGGPGELMKIDVIVPLIEKALSISETIPRQKKRVVLMDPAGVLFSQAHAECLSHYEELIFVCGRYEGIDARVNHYIDEAISIGDYVLSAGDLAAMVVFDATVRMIPGFLGNVESALHESHRRGRLESSQYTRPSVFAGLSVPEVFLSGHHGEIEKARQLESALRTSLVRPDLIEQFPFSDEEIRLLDLPEKDFFLYPWMKKS